MLEVPRGEAGAALTPKGGGEEGCRVKEQGDLLRKQGDQHVPGQRWRGKEEGRTAERPEVRLLGPSDDLQKRQLLMKPQHGHLQTQPRSHQVLESSQEPPGPHHAP